MYPPFTVRGASERAVQIVERPAATAAGFATSLDRRTIGRSATGGRRTSAAA